MLSTDLFYKNIDDQYRALTGKASRPEKARTLGKLIGNGISRAIAQTGAQAVDETTVNAKQAAESLIRSEIDEQKRLSDERSQRARRLLELQSRKFFHLWMLASHLKCKYLSHKISWARYVKGLWRKEISAKELEKTLQ